MSADHLPQVSQPATSLPHENPHEARLGRERALRMRRLLLALLTRGPS